MSKTLWTVEQAREMGLRSAQRRAERKANPLPTVAPMPVVDGLPTTTATVDVVGHEFTCAMIETLREFRAAKDYKEKASLARSMREVRETYHLYSGAPKPGTIKPERVSSRQSVKQPSEPKLDTTDGGLAS